MGSCYANIINECDTITHSIQPRRVTDQITSIIAGPTCSNENPISKDVLEFE